MPLLCYRPGIISGTMLTSESLEERQLPPLNCLPVILRALRSGPQTFICVKLLPLFSSSLPLFPLIDFRTFLFPISSYHLHWSFSVSFWTLSIAIP